MQKEAKRRSKGVQHEINNYVFRNLRDRFFVDGNWAEKDAGLVTVGRAFYLLTGAGQKKRRASAPEARGLSPHRRIDSVTGETSAMGTVAEDLPH